MFTRSGTSSGYFGCVDIAIITEFASNIFEGDHFIRHYLNSPVQRGFSATCLQTVRYYCLINIKQIYPRDLHCADIYQRGWV